MSIELQHVYDEEFHDDLVVLLEGGDERLLRTLLARLHPADLADALEHLDPPQRQRVFELIAPEDRAPAIIEMDEGLREQLLDALDTPQIAEFVARLDSDDAADLLQTLSPEVAERVLAAISPADARRLRRLLAFPEDTAGGIMAAEVVAVPERDSVAQAIERLRAAGEAQADIPHLFVVDDSGRLTGILTLRDMLLRDGATAVGAIVDREVRAVPATMDQEEVVDLARKYDLAVVPVIDHHGRLIGQITIDDILEAYEEEASEDFIRFSGGLEEESPGDSVVTVSRNRLPWLVLGLIGGAVSAWVMSRFEGEFSAAMQIAFFIPVIMAMGGNVGMQSSATIVRGIATGEVDRPNARARLTKEIIVGVVNALVLAVLLWGIVTLWLGRWHLAIVVGVSLAVTMTMAAIVGSAVPLMLKRLGADPALATGPFVTTSNDIIGLTIYLALTTALLRWI